MRNILIKLTLWWNKENGSRLLDSQSKRNSNYTAVVLVNDNSNALDFVMRRLIGLSKKLWLTVYTLRNTVGNSLTSLITSQIVGFHDIFAASNAPVWDKTAEMH